MCVWTSGRLRAGTTAGDRPSPLSWAAASDDDGGVELTEMLPVRAPDADGVNTTAMLQLLCGGSAVAQALLAEKSPETTGERSVAVALPVFVRVRV